MPGTILTREYKGETVRVTVLPNGFDFEGEVYPSLSAAAKAIRNARHAHPLRYRACHSNSHLDHWNLLRKERSH